MLPRRNTIVAEISLAGPLCVIVWTVLSPLADAASLLLVLRGRAAHLPIRLLQSETLSGPVSLHTWNSEAGNGAIERLDARSLASLCKTQSVQISFLSIQRSQRIILALP